MKTKIIIALIFSVLCSFSAMGQTIGNDSIPKSKPEYLPKAGEFGVGVDATPFLNYLGNMLSSAGTNTLNLTQLSTLQSKSVKY
jgi:hypothetical protein